MVFNLTVEIILGIGLGFFLWLLILSIFVYRALKHYNRLTSGIVKEDLKSVLENLLAKVGISEKKIEEILARCEKIESEGRFHIQKIGVLRFNPFKDMGGDQSFVLAILDGHDNGIVISSLHSRSGTRWYAKAVKEGKSQDYELSEEEKETIKKAKTF